MIKHIILILILTIGCNELIAQVPYINEQWGFEVERIGEPVESNYNDGFHLYMERRTLDRTKYLSLEIDIFRFDQIIENPLAFSDSLLAMEFLAGIDQQGEISLLKRDDIEVDSIPGILANIRLQIDKSNILNIVYLSFCKENIYYVVLYGSPTQTFDAIEEHAKSFHFTGDQ
ncbi:hypothetical protein ACFLRY_02750 [Bacteroidota bacterium]